MNRLVEHLRLGWLRSQLDSTILASCCTTFTSRPRQVFSRWDTLYEPHLRSPRWLPHSYAPYRPGLVNVIVEATVPEPRRRVPYDTK